MPSRVSRATLGHVVARALEPRSGVSGGWLALGRRLAPRPRLRLAGWAAAGRAPAVDELDAQAPDAVGADRHVADGRRRLEVAAALRDADLVPDRRRDRRRSGRARRAARCCRRACARRGPDTPSVSVRTSTRSTLMREARVPAALLAVDSGAADAVGSTARRPASAPASAVDGRRRASTRPARPATTRTRCRSHAGRASASASAPPTA